MNTRVVRLIGGLGLSLATAMPLWAQHDATSFSLSLENDTFTNSDTGYTNGVRLAWTIARFRRGMRIFTDYNLATALDGGLRAIGLGRIGLTRHALIPDSLSNTKCETDNDRALRELGACTLLTFGIAQTMYTPDSLATTRLQPRDQPYAGFLYAMVGVVTLDSPRNRQNHSKNWLSFTQVSNQVVVGVTGRPAGAQNTQALAHWTASPDSHRPLGWNNQLRAAPQVGLVTDITVRPTFFEYCRAGCTGLIDEKRRADLTPHTEAIIGTQLVRFTAGITGRIGIDFPDMAATARIPVQAPPSGKGTRRGLTILGSRYWLYGLGNAELRYVPYNMFVAGGIADGGRAGWRTVRQITPRHKVGEWAYGFAFGNAKVSAGGQYAFRTPEYDVTGFRRSHGLHGYGSFMLTIHSQAVSRQLTH